MEEKHDFQKELAKNLRKKRIRRIVLGVIAIAAVIYTASIFSIEGKDSLLPDGQGNIVDYQQEQQVQEEQQAADELQQDEQQNDDSDTQSGEEEQADEPKQKPADDRPTKEEAKDMTAEELKVDNSKDPTASNDGNRAYKPDVPEPVTVRVLPIPSSSLIPISSTTSRTAPTPSVRPNT